MYFDCEYDYNEQEKTDGGLGAGTPMFISEVMHGSACTLVWIRFKTFRPNSVLKFLNEKSKKKKNWKGFARNTRKIKKFRMEIKARKQRWKGKQN